MAERQELIFREQGLTEELHDIRKKLREFEEVARLTSPIYKLEKKWESKLGVKLRIRKSSITSKAQRNRIRLMEYLIKHDHTSENPISYRELSNVLGIKNIVHLLQTRATPYSPLHGGLKVERERYGRGYRIRKLYIEDIERADTYVGLMKELIILPLKTS